jgi:serpin B
MPFGEHAAVPEDFTLSSGEKIKVPTMQKEEFLHYLKAANFSAVKIPYKGHDLSMIVLLPSSADGLADLEKSLTWADVQKWVAAMKPEQVNLKLPKFKVTSEFSLKKVLSDMGMPIAFGGGADFTGISTQSKLFIQEVVHKAFVDVNEAGTEAAAATAVIVGDKAGPPPAKLAFHVNRPFVFLLYDNHTGSILFTGRVANPK